MAVATQYNDGVRPVLTQIINKPSGNRKGVCTLASSAGLKDGGDLLTGYSFVDMQGHIATVAIMGVKQRQFLLAIC